MTALLLGALSAVWLGILTSVSPCPLATNIAAISFISRRFSRTRIVFLTGLLYTLGRIFAYVVVAVLIVSSLLSVPQLSYFLQKYANKLLGPVLIVVGMILLELIRFNLPGFGVSGKMQKRVEACGIWGAALLGILFALSFCPISAALFFGSLIPLALKYRSGVTLPALYGLGTGLPVFLFALILAFASKSTASAFNKLKQFELWVRRATGAIFVVIGIYYCLAYIFGVLP
ncbi:MAG: aromatic aminobenezylarsenical efflux permease ArsG family transporter [Planctomycetota bacterium]|jgi:cytochrome c biogenesis protein CcdA